MNAKALLDTNIIICLFDSTDRLKQNKAERLVFGGLENGDACISQQVLHESLNVFVRKLNFTFDDAQRVLNDILLPLCIPIPPASLYNRALVINSRFKYGFYDSLVIASAVELGCRQVFTEDLQNGQTLETVTIVNPFLAE
ncbi:MAG: PIN domain-containing protein [Pseudomonadota bacterium]